MYDTCSLLFNRHYKTSTLSGTSVTEIHSEHITKREGLLKEYIISWGRKGPICSENTEPRDITCDICVSLALTFLDLPLSFTNPLVHRIPSPMGSWRDSRAASGSLPSCASFCIHLFVAFLPSIHWVSHEAPLGSFFVCNVQKKTKALRTSAKCIIQKRT